ncbi:hypothetical protein lerEdw1_013889, partial [Lerista edwardsae]
NGATCNNFLSFLFASFPVAFGLYFPRVEYDETIYLDEPEGTPLLQIHALKDSEEEEVYFWLCPLVRIPQVGLKDNLWFQIGEKTGLLFLNKSLEREDVDQLFAGKWVPMPKLMLQVYLSSEPFQLKECLDTKHNKVWVQLSIISAPLPACSSLMPSQLCFVNMDFSFHIKENKPPGTFHQLQSHSLQYLCQNVSVSYKVIADEGLPFRYDEDTMSISVTQILDREEREKYELIAKCTAREGSRETTKEVPLLISVLDEDDTPPFLPNGTSTADAVVEFSRKEGTVLATLTVYDADTTSVYPIESRKKYTGTISTSDPWIKEKFRVEHDFHEIKFSPNGSQVRGTRHEYKLVLNKNMSVTESRSFQLDVVVNDTEYKGPDKSLLLHFNVSILPINIQFSNMTYQFRINRNAANFSQIGKICIDNCMRFYGVNITYSLQPPNVSCYAMKITQRHEDKYGSLYVNDSAVLRRPDCKEIQYPVLAKEEWSSKEARAYIMVVLSGACKLFPNFGLS